MPSGLPSLQFILTLQVPLRQHPLGPSPAHFLCPSILSWGHASAGGYYFGAIVLCLQLPHPIIRAGHPSGGVQPAIAASTGGDDRPICLCPTCGRS